jgi:hypothetical protein
MVYHRFETFFFCNYSADKARSASGRPTTRDAQHPESGVLNSYLFFIFFKTWTAFKE